ncbi:hypothetical protein M0R45_003042 [Rubus argutus]|uniref:Uncharacterized protein n=1 Tax=Rubus argutus TaxID=59490 RepID=A0AAW1YDV9_RUBAR
MDIGMAHIKFKWAETTERDHSRSKALGLRSPIPILGYSSLTLKFFSWRRFTDSTANVNREEHVDLQQQPLQRNSASSSGGENPANQAASRVSDGSAFAGDSGARVVPIRTVCCQSPTIRACW